MTDCTQEVADELYAITQPTSQLLLESTTSCSAETTAAIGDWARHVQDYANDNLFTTGTSRNSFTDANRAALIKQSTPQVIGSTSFIPLLTIGHDLTIKSFSQAQTLYESDAYARQLFLDTVDLVARLEQSSLLPESVIDVGVRLAENHYLPFTDLCNWCEKSPEDLDEALTLLRRYLQVTNPRVMFTWGEHVTSTAFGKFEHDLGLRSGTLLQSVATPRVTSYGPQSDACVIVIPSYHPSPVSYGRIDTDAFLELFQRSLYVAWLATSFACRFASDYSTKRELLDAVTDAMPPIIGEGTRFQ